MRARHGPNEHLDVPLGRLGYACRRLGQAPLNPGGRPTIGTNGSPGDIWHEASRQTSGTRPQSRGPGLFVDADLTLGQFQDDVLALDADRERGQR